MIEKHISINNTNIYYKIAGSGKAVVLIHGFAESSSIWNNQVAFLKNMFLIITPDLPGTGKSGQLQNENAGMEEYAHCVHLILQQENIRQCVLIGHSMGGYISLAFAEKYPDQLMALGLFHSSPYADDDERIEKRKKGIFFISETGAHAFLKTSIPGLFYNTKKNNADIDQLIKTGATFIPTALIQYYSAMINRPDRTSVLKSFTHPVLFILGKHDQAVPYQTGLKQTYLPQQAYIYVLRKTAHMGMLEETAKSNKGLLAFLQII